MLTAPPHSDFSRAWTHVDAADAGTTDVSPDLPWEWANVEAAVAGTTYVSPDLSDEAVWGSFPDDYWKRVSEAYGRFGGSKMQKYQVAAYRVEERFGSMEAFANAWVRPRFDAWLHDRRLDQRLRPLQPSGCSEMQLWHKRIAFIKYKYILPEYRPSFRQRDTVFHGTYTCCAARLLHTGQFHCSDPRTPGSDCRWREPCVFTADTMNNAIGYAWPAPILEDNLYYGIMLELEADTERIMNRHEWASGRSRHAGEKLFPPDALIIRNVFLLVNLDLAQGSSKCQELNPYLEMLPFTVGDSLTPDPLRDSTWSTWHNRHS